MINLLPPETKNIYRYGRSNRHLMHWVIACSLGIVGVALITGFGYFYLDHTAKTYAKQIDATNKQLSDQKLASVQKQVKDMSNNLNLAVEVLSKQVLFSELLQQLGKLMPDNTRLSGLSIVQAQSGLDISATAQSYSDATQIQVNLTDPNNNIFSKADIVSINCAGAAEYPCNVVIRGLFLPNNPYMFKNSKAAS